MSPLSVASKSFAAALFAAGLLASAGVGAVDVENQDSKDHKVTLTESGGKKEIEVKAGETQLDLCAICTVSVEGMEPVEASGLDRVIIKDGKLTKVEQ